LVLEIVGYILVLIVGACVTNGIPHYIKGVTGQSHMTVFNKVSSPTVNVLWGLINWFLAFILYVLFNSFTDNFTGIHMIVAIIGGVLISLRLAKLWSNPDAKLPWHKE
jgi:hypothetical protein|tara:strand:- start:45 stop:368 length:324 start_codon:yes stop_codon:yes gene_type:complete